MKQAIITILALLTLAVSCAVPTGEAKEANTMTREQKKIEYNTRWREEHEAKTMHLYDTRGVEVTSCYALRGEYDGHSWYVFYDNLAVPAVVHDPLCKLCNPKNEE